MFWSGFLMQMQWWCLFSDWSNHIWQYRQTHKCYICSGVVFLCEFNGDVYVMIGVTIYGNTSKKIGIIYVLRWYCHIWSLWSWNGHHHWICIKKLLQNIYNTYVFATIAKYGYSDYETDITIEFASKNPFRTYITLGCLLVLPNMVTPIMKQTSPLNLHQKTAPEHI